MECMVCLQSDNVIQTVCCRGPVHQSCLDKWLDSSSGNCPHCRCRLRSPRGIPQDLGLGLALGQGFDTDALDDSEIEDRWSNPRGYIHIATGHGHCDIHMETDTALEPIVHKCPFQSMEDQIPDQFITDGHVIVLTNEEGNYFDTINIPVGWMVSVNNVNQALQLTQLIRLE